MHEIFKNWVQRVLKIVSSDVIAWQTFFEAKLDVSPTTSFKLHF